MLEESSGLLAAKVSTSDKALKELESTLRTMQMSTEALSTMMGLNQQGDTPSASTIQIMYQMEEKLQKSIAVGAERGGSSSDSRGSSSRHGQ